MFDSKIIYKFPFMYMCVYMFRTKRRTEGVGFIVMVVGESSGSVLRVEVKGIN